MVALVECLCGPTIQFSAHDMQCKFVDFYNSNARTQLDNAVNQKLNTPLQLAEMK